MAHLNRIWTDSILVRGYITGVELRDLDVNTYKAVDGDGGSWTPSSPIEIGGAGMVAAGRGWIMFGAGAVATTGVGAPIEFDKGYADDYFGFGDANTMRTPSCVTELGHPVVNSPYSFNGFNISNTPRWNTVKSYFAYVRIPSNSATDTPIQFVCPINVYNGAYIDTATLRFTVGYVHSNVPQNLPKIRIIAVDEEGNILVLRNADSTTDPDGYQPIGAPVSGSAWYNSGAEQTFNYVCNVSHKIDVSKYSYYVDVIEENGNDVFIAGSGNTYHSLSISFADILIFDGRN